MNRLRALRAKHPRLCDLVAVVLLVGVTTTVILLRYPPALSIPNFYAEDGTVFLQNIFEKNLFGAITTPFNGYFVAGQYLVAGSAVAVYEVLGLPFYLLPSLVALASGAFLGLTVSLPFLLFRMELGWRLSLAVVAVSAFFPLTSSDYAVVGTIGNLKFAFMYWAFLFVIYRNMHYRDKAKTILSDGVLLLCVLTNITTVALLPFLLWPYRRRIIALIKKPRSLTGVRGYMRADTVGLAVLLPGSVLYAITMYLRGIPVLPGYLDAPYVWAATVKILYRVTFYPFLFPLSKHLNDVIVIIILLAMLWAVLYLNKKSRLTFLFALFAIFVATISFVVTRPGVGEFMLKYGASPDQFFYAQGLIFVFACAWVLKNYTINQHHGVYLAVVVVAVLAATAPFASSYGRNKVLYDSRGSAYTNITSQCNYDRSAKAVVIPIYPAAGWNWKVDRKVACN